MTPNEALIHRFYSALQKKDAVVMKDCYHPRATFYDPVFTDLNSDQVKAMWEMLCKNGRDLKVEFTPPKEKNGIVTTRWDARYTFSRSGNKVHTIINAEFEFKSGVIFRHKDDFSFSRWAGMALGLPGKFLGWTSYLKNKVRRDAAARLQQFIAKK